MSDHVHVPPSDCPVCGERLNIVRLGCGSCGAELSGRFESCPYCSLAAQDRRILHTFLVSRGNMRELARELGVSYPTARQRFAELLVKLGVESAETEVTGDSEAIRRVQSNRRARADAETNAKRRMIVLERLAAGDLDMDEAEAFLGRYGT